jgi:hypothetical protein
VENYYTTITGTTADSFTVTVNTNLTTSGTSGAYTLAYTVSLGTNALTIVAPSGGMDSMNCDSVRFRGTSSSGQTFDLVVPSGVSNGFGDNTALSNFTLPVFIVRANLDTLGPVAATIAVNNASAGYNSYRFAGLAASTIRLFAVVF